MCGSENSRPIRCSKKAGSMRFSSGGSHTSKRASLRGRPSLLFQVLAYLPTTLSREHLLVSQEFVRRGMWRGRKFLGINISTLRHPLSQIQPPLRYQNPSAQRYCTPCLPLLQEYFPPLRVANEDHDAPLTKSRRNCRRT